MEYTSQNSTNNTNNFNPASVNNDIDQSANNEPIANSVPWRLMEMVAVASADQGSESQAPIQLYKHQPRDLANQSHLWVLSGFNHKNSPDNLMSTWFSKSVNSFKIRPRSQVYLTPIANPEGIKSKQMREASMEEIITMPFMQTLKRWSNNIAPKLVVTLSSGPRMIRYLGDIPYNILEKVSYLAERPFYVYGEEPMEEADLQEERNLGAVFGHWCQDAGIAWMDISIENESSNIDDLKAGEWRSCIGPALKWLSEATPYDIKEEPKPKHEVIGVVELPAQFQ